MRPQPHAQEQIARRTAADAGCALPGQADALPVADAARDLDLEVRAVAEREPAPTASLDPG